MELFTIILITFGTSVFFTIIGISIQWLMIYRWMDKFFEDRRNSLEEFLKEIKNDHLN